MHCDVFYDKRNATAAITTTSLGAERRAGGAPPWPAPQIEIIRKASFSSFKKFLVVIVDGDHM